MTPTLNGSRILAYLDQDTHATDDYLKYLGPGLQRTCEGRVARAASDDAAAVARRHERFEKMRGCCRCCSAPASPSWPAPTRGS